MRAFRLVVASLLVAAGLTAVAAPSAYADNEPSLGVSPGHGGPDSEFTATLRWQPPKHGRNRPCQPDQVTFTWDGDVLGRAAAARVGDACVATLQATPPPGTYDAVTTHTIGVDGVRAGRARYIVVPATDATPTPTATDATPTPDVTDTATADAQSAGIGRNDAPAAKAAAGGLSGISGLAVTVGILLFLAGAATFGLLVWRARSTQDGDEVGVLPADPTRPLPAGFGRSLPPDLTQPLYTDRGRPLPAEATQPLHTDLTQPLPVNPPQPPPTESTQPPAEPTRPLPTPRQPGDEQDPQTYHWWPPNAK